MLIVFVLGSVLVSSVFLSWLWFFLLFCCCLFSCFFLYGLSSIFFRFGFSFLNSFFSVFVFPCHCFRTKSAFALTCKHGRVDIGTMPIMSRMILVRGGKSGTRIRYRLGSLFAQLGPYGSGCAGSILAYRFGVGLSRYQPISKVMPRLRYRLVVCLSSLMDTACDHWSIRDHFGSGPIYRHVIRMPISVRLIWVN